jgi:hypothetical protein
MADDPLKDLTARVEHIEKSVHKICERLFVVERKLLITGSVFTMGDSAPEGNEKRELNALNDVSQLLGNFSSDLKLRLQDLLEDEDECCPMLAGTGPDDQKA